MQLRTWSISQEVGSIAKGRARDSLSTCHSQSQSNNPWVRTLRSVACYQQDHRAQFTTKSGPFLSPSSADAQPKPLQLIGIFRQKPLLEDQDRHQGSPLSFSSRYSSYWGRVTHSTFDMVLTADIVSLAAMSS